ncbi:hypothetical protein Lal_00025007 [Lupinus albus]|nr:hypothetical protein Lal_00025007 [Lupinus albus]
MRPSIYTTITTRRLNTRPGKNRRQGKLKRRTITITIRPTRAPTHNRKIVCCQSTSKIGARNNGLKRNTLSNINREQSPTTPTNNRTIPSPNSTAMFSSKSQPRILKRHSFWNINLTKIIASSTYQKPI